MCDKKKIREQKLITLKETPTKEILKKSIIINKKIQDTIFIRNATSIALYFSQSHEVQTINLINNLLKKDKQILLPRITGSQLKFKRIYNTKEHLEQTNFGLYEPIEALPTTPIQLIDLIIMPCVAISTVGNRIGYGKGFYDTTLQKSNFTSLLLALAFEDQLIESFKPEKHDIPVDIIITEKKIYTPYANKIIDGKKYSINILTKIKKKINKEKLNIGLGVILVGNDHASKVYVNIKKKACIDVGIKFHLKHLPQNSNTQDILSIIDNFNQQKSIVGILIQLPLPKQIDMVTAINSIDPIKDIDGLTTINREKLKTHNHHLTCCTPKGILRLLEIANISLKNKKICLIGNGFLVGNPLSLMLANNNINYNVCDQSTDCIAQISQQADIVISAVGKPNLISNEYIKKGAIIIDAGTAKYKNTTVGDVDFNRVIQKASRITPVPGGVGPMTIATLIENCLQAYTMQKNLQNLDSLFKHLAVVTSQESWFIPYAQQFCTTLQNQGLKCQLYNDYKQIPKETEVVFILSYFSIIKQKDLAKYKHNLVIHESNLPQGKGWAPLFWQILEGKNNIPIVLFEANQNIDAGHIYLKDTIHLDGTELHEEIRLMQAKKTIELCLKFLCNYHNLIPQKQQGSESFYAKRTPQDSELDPNKSIANQFNKLRIASNSDYPAFFNYKGKKYILKIDKIKQ